MDAEYDIEVARYLAESGVHLAKWQNENASAAASEIGFGKLDLPGIGSLVAGTIEREGQGRSLHVSVSATHQPRATGPQPDRNKGRVGPRTSATLTRMTLNERGRQRHHDHGTGSVPTWQARTTLS